MSIEFVGMWALIVALLIYLIVIFNRLIRDRNLVRNGHADIDVQLQRRHDLVPQLVESVRAYAGFERSLLNEITELRARARQATDDEGTDREEARLADRLSRLLLLAEDYPDLKASENFRQLSDELVQVEDHLQHARRFYNGAVRQYNTRVGQFPDLLLAALFGFTEAHHFSADIQARGVPRVQLDDSGSTADPRGGTTT